MALVKVSEMVQVMKWAMGRGMQLELAQVMKWV